MKGKDTDGMQAGPSLRPVPGQSQMLWLCLGSGAEGIRNVRMGSQGNSLSKEHSPRETQEPTDSLPWWPQGSTDWDQELIRPGGCSPKFLKTETLS